VSGHAVQWVTASPLWPQALDADAAEVRERMRRPALLRFDSDAFMDDLRELLDDDPDRLTELEARKESHRPPPPGEGPEWQPALERLKLFQAAHGRFYLVAATLACRMPGLPEHPADTSKQESVSFVLRRIVGGVEWAWVTRAGAAPAWAPVAAEAETALVEGEDELPLFPLNYEHRETFKAAGPLSPLEPEPVPPGETADPRRLALETLVLAPMRELPHAPTPESPLGGDELAAAILAAAEMRLEVSRFALIELIGLLRTSIPDLFDAITEGGTPDPGPVRTFYQRLGTATAGPVSWRDALATAWLEHLAIAGEDDDMPITLAADLALTTLSADALEGLFRDALPPLASTAGAAGATGATGPPRPVDVPKLDARGDGVYRLRCVYRRPHCGVLAPDVISDPTNEFTIASFYDLDAPVRPVMISLPIDTSLKDLRRFQKGVSFLISDELRKQMSRATSLKEAIDGNVGSGQQFNLGLICSFSIPIITIVALILLMLIVSLLNFVFGWLPYLRICFPLALRSRS
jgi:hypothetical protein